MHGAHLLLRRPGKGRRRLCLAMRNPLFGSGSRFINFEGR